MDTPHLQSYLKAAFPDRPSVLVHSLSGLSDGVSGWETEIFSFILKYDTPHGVEEEDLILRMFPAGTSGRKAMAEYESLRLLRDSGYPVPRVHLVEGNASKLGGPFIIMDRIHGRPMGLLPLIQNDRLTDTGETFCRLFLELHRLDWKPFVSDPSQYSSQDMHHYTRSYLSDFGSFITSLGVGGMLPVLNWLENRVFEVPCERPSVIHGDFHPFNILVTEENEPYVIDWTSCRVTDPRIDLGWTLMMIGTFDNSKSRDLVLAGYEHILGREVENIHFFEVLGVLRRFSDLTIFLAESSEKSGLREGISETMKQHVDHFRNVHDLLQDYTELRLPEIDNLLDTLE